MQPSKNMIENLKNLRETAKFSAEIMRNEAQEIHAYYTAELTKILTEGPYIDWVDIKEEQPAVFGQYIAQIKGAEVPAALYYNPGTKEWSDTPGATYNVVAWQPFPAKYERAKK